MLQHPQQSQYADVQGAYSGSTVEQSWQQTAPELCIAEQHSDRARFALDCAAL